jgi:hypothetical protein
MRNSLTPNYATRTDSRAAFAPRGATSCMGDLIGVTKLEAVHVASRQPG